jgi:hypothetical protein
MDVAYLSALAALAGSVVGGFTMGLSTWLASAVKRAPPFSRTDLAARGPVPGILSSRHPRPMARRLRERSRTMPLVCRRSWVDKNDVH